ncbi:hypothetical protein GCM10028791_43660 [Echinicola sediminis]
MDFNLFDSFVEDLLGEKNPRPIIIVGASRIDDLLYRIICKHLLPKNSKKSQQDELLEGDNPIGTFSSRIKIVSRLGIIDKELYKILEQIRSIRNRSAHSIEFNIKKSPLREQITELKKMVLKRKSYERTLERYFKGVDMNEIKELQCIMITICVLLEAISETIETTSGYSQTMEISNK